MSNTTYRNLVLDVDDGEWCEIEIRWTGTRLSITGSAGSLIPQDQGREQALEYWAAYFEDEPQECARMSQEHGNDYDSCGCTKLLCAEHCAQLVLDIDGDYHGLDVHAELDGDYPQLDEPMLALTHSCGQITGELRLYFPQFKKLMPWHLNDMRPNCVHQKVQLADADSVPCPHSDCVKTGYDGLIGYHPVPYRYGSAWKFHPLPQYALDMLENIGLTAHLETQ